MWGCSMLQEKEGYMRDLEDLIPQLETTMREKAELEQELASARRAAQVCMHAFCHHCAGICNQ